MRLNRTFFFLQRAHHQKQVNLSYLVPERGNRRPRKINHAVSKKVDEKKAVTAARARPKCTKIGPAQPSPAGRRGHPFVPWEMMKSLPGPELIDPVAMATGRRFHLA